MSKLNIIIVNDFAHINGGAGKVALSSAIGLAKRGHAVTFFSAVPPVMEELYRDNLTVICLNQYDILTDPNRLRAIGQGIWNYKASQMMSKLLYMSDPARTIVHLHSWTKALSSSVVRNAIKNKFNIVCTLHDYFALCPNGGLFNYKTQKICHLVPLSYECIFANCDVRSYPQKMWRVVRQIVQNRFGLIPDGIINFIVVSEFSNKVLKPYLPSYADIELLENPIDVLRVKPANVAENKAFIFIGRLSPEKGPHLLAKAVNQLAGCESIYVGDGVSKTDIINICPSAKIIGWVSGDEVKRNLLSARALVFPSLLYETQGLVVLEAAALGVPSIVADTGAARDIVEDGVTGLWFKGGDLDDLVRKIKIMQNPDIARQMGLAAYERYWSDPLTMDRHIDQLEEHYTQILKYKK